MRKIVAKDENGTEYITILGGTTFAEKLLLISIVVFLLTEQTTYLLIALSAWLLLDIVIPSIESLVFIALAKKEEYKEEE